MGIRVGYGIWPRLYGLGAVCNSRPKEYPFPRPPNVPLLRALWSLLDGIWGLLEGRWGVLVMIFNEFGVQALAAQQLVALQIIVSCGRVCTNGRVMYHAYRKNCRPSSATTWRGRALSK